LSHWLQKVIKLFKSESVNLRDLAKLAGGDPRTFYIGANLDGADLSGQDLRGMTFSNFNVDKVKIDSKTKLDPKYLPLAMNVDGKSASPGVDFPGQLAQLRHLRRQEWQTQWLRLWNKAKDRRELTSVAVDWLKIQPIESVELPIVLLTVLNFSRENSSLRELAARWLTLNQFSLIYWGRLWLLVTAKASTEDKIEFMEVEGFTFLETTIEIADRKSVETWSLIWNRLRRRRKLSKRLVQLAQHASKIYGDHTRFVQLVLPHVTSEPFARKRLIGWLKNAPQRSASWPDIYVRLINQTETDDEVVSMGIHWLQSNPNLSRWKKVWDAVLLKTGDHGTLIRIARDWLERTYPDIYVWPEVMASVIAAGVFSETEIDTARKWLVSHGNRKKTKTYSKLENLVLTATNHSYEIVSLYHSLEKTLNSSVKFKGMQKKRITTLKMAEILFENDELDGETYRILAILTRMRNREVHQPRGDASPKVVLRFKELARKVINNLKLD
jgi:hypothetical protein